MLHQWPLLLPQAGITVAIFIVQAAPSAEELSSLLPPKVF